MEVEGPRRGVKRGRTSTDAAVERFLKKIDNSIEKRGVARTVKKYHTTSFAPETKYFDTAFAASVTCAGTSWADSEVPMTSYVNSSGAVAAYTDSALIPSAIGSGYGQVIGNKYKLKAVRVKGILFPPTATVATTPALSRVSRILLVMDTQPSGTQAQGEDILQDMGAGPNNYSSYVRVSEGAGKRFVILADRKFKHPVVVGVQTGTLVADPIQNGASFAPAHFEFAYSPKKPVEVQVKSANATPTIAGLVNRNIFMLAYGMAYDGTMIALGISGNARAYYCD